MATNQVGNVVDINSLLQALNAQNHLQMLSQQARSNTGLQEDCQSEDQGSAENEENDFIAESESTQKLLNLSRCHSKLLKEIL